MPSKTTKDVMTMSSLRHLSIALCCATLMACGGGGSGTSRSQDNSTDTEQPAEDTVSMNVLIPMHVKNATLKVYLAGKSDPIYSQSNFTGFETADIDVAQSELNKVLVVELIGNDSSTMFDPIKQTDVPFQGTLHAVNTMKNNLSIVLSPLSEAVYQRTILRAGNLDFSAPDWDLIESKHISKSVTEINTVFNQAFNLTNFTKFSHSQSISALSYDSKNEKNYVNTMLGLGMLNLWQQRYPNSVNNYVELATNIGIDLRDGSLDGRTIQGDNSTFQKLVDAPKNTDPSKNSLEDIGAVQATARRSFGEDLKQATLDYATQSYQQITNVDGFELLSDMDYYQTEIFGNSSTIYRWFGAGDYRPAFGFTGNATCTSSAYPCLQGLNADDTGTERSQIEYLIGTHKVQNCQLEILASGDVTLSKGNKVIIGQINRDQSDNLLRLDTATQSYLLNIGAGEIIPPHFIQLEVKNAQIVDAHTGNSQNKFPALQDLSFGDDDIRSCS